MQLSQKIGIRQEMRRHIRQVLREEMNFKLMGLYQAYGKEKRKHLNPWKKLDDAYPYPSPGGRLKKRLPTYDSDHEWDIED